MKDAQCTITLNNGLKIPCIGFGTWKIKEGDEARDAVKTALEAGYYHIDTAADYGNEASVGEAVRQSGIAREEVFVTSKLWNAERGYDEALAAFERTLDVLGLEYLDLYLIHWPAARGVKAECDAINSETWRAFELLYQEGRAKAIGVSNFKPHHLEPLIDKAEVMPMVNQIEFHPGCMQEETRSYCLANDILIEAWSPLGSGRIMEDARLSAIAGRYSCSVAQLCIRWCLQNQAVPLPKSTTPKHIFDNAAVFGFEIAPEDMAAINAFLPFGLSGLDPDTVRF